MVKTAVKVPPNIQDPYIYTDISSPEAKEIIFYVKALVRFIL